MRDNKYAFIPTEQYNYVVQQLEKLFQKGIIDSAYFILNQYPIFNQVIALSQKQPVLSYLISCVLEHPLNWKELYLEIPSLSVLQELKDVEIFNDYCALPDYYFRQGRIKDLDPFLLPEALGDCRYTDFVERYAGYFKPYVQAIQEENKIEENKIIIQMETKEYSVFEIGNVNAIATLRLRLYQPKKVETTLN
jgi:hypothetical protein